EVRAPRVDMSWPSQRNSSGIQLRPTPRPIRLFDSTAADATAFAVSRGSRMPSFRTFVYTRSRSVTAAIAPIATNGSRKGVSGGQKRDPSGVYGYFADTSSG